MDRYFGWTDTMNHLDRVELLVRAKACAKKVGIYDKMFLSFGTLLGAIRPTMRKDRKFYRGIMEHDKDMDIGWLPMPAEKKKEYYEECLKAGLLNWQGRTDRCSWDDKGKELLWFSIKQKHPRSCNWFFFEWKNYMWHTKGLPWVSTGKFPNHFTPSYQTAKAFLLGAPAKYFDHLVEIDFEGEKFNVPSCAGSLCDFWYPNWFQPKKGGASSKQVVGVVSDWNNQREWKII